jgi:hypothetical protein
VIGSLFVQAFRGATSGRRSSPAACHTPVLDFSREGVDAVICANGHRYDEPTVAT